jgi:hypothetical protein
VATKRSRSPLIEQNPHSRDFQRPGCVLQNAPSLLRRDAWKPLQEVLHGSAVFDVFKHRGDRHTSTAKYPCAANVVSGSLDIRT